MKFKIIIAIFLLGISTIAFPEVYAQNNNLFVSAENPSLTTLFQVQW